MQGQRLPKVVIHTCADNTTCGVVAARAQPRALRVPCQQRCSGRAAPPRPPRVPGRGCHEERRCGDRCGQSIWGWGQSGTSEDHRVRFSGLAMRLTIEVRRT